MKRYPFVSAWSFLLACLIAGCTPRASTRQVRDEDARLPRLETVVPQLTELDMTSDLTATVEAFEKADLCAQVRGTVNVIPLDVEIGRAIKKDEVLIVLDIPDLVADREHKVAMKEQADKLRDQAEQSRNVAAAEV